MRAVWDRAIEVAAIAAFGLFTGFLAWQCRAALAQVWIAVPCAIAGYLAADVASGLVHWMCDNCFAEDSPLIGGMLIQPFRDHHRDPLGITTHGFLELCGNSCLGLLPALAAVVCLGDRLPALLQAGFLFFCLAMFATNQFHQWAHAPAVPQAVRWLQKHRVILSPASHQAHHRTVNGGAYCITSGWMNRPLDRILGIR